MKISYSKEISSKRYFNFSEVLRLFFPLFWEFGKISLGVFFGILVVSPAFGQASPTPSPGAGDVSPVIIPGPTPLPTTASSPTEAALAPPTVGTEDATQNVNTAEPSSAPDAGPPPPPEGGPVPGSPTAADPNALIPTGEKERTLPPQATVEQAQKVSARELAKYKAAKIQAEKVPSIRSMYELAQKATTEEDYRAAMRTYYRMLFKKIELIDPSLAEKARGMQEAYLRRLAQTRIEPTIPLRPPPTPAPLTP